MCSSGTIDSFCSSGTIDSFGHGDSDCLFVAVQFWVEGEKVKSGGKWWSEFRGFSLKVNWVVLTPCAF